MPRSIMSLASLRTVRRSTSSIRSSPITGRTLRFRIALSSAIVRGRWKLVSNNGNWELYDLHGDPGEHFNLIKSQSKTQIAAERRALLEQHEALGNVSPFP